MYVYMQVTKDEYELPLAMADSIPKLAEMIGIKTQSIYDSMKNAKKLGRKTPYKKVDVGVSEEMVILRRCPFCGSEAELITEIAGMPFLRYSNALFQSSN